MATEQPTVTTPSASFAKWATWIAAIVGLWVLASPFVLSGSIGSGAAMWSTVVAGLLVVVLAAYGAYAIRTAAESAPNSPAEIAGWIAAVIGIWIAASPFVLDGTVGSGAPMQSGVVAGLLAAVLAAYAGYDLHETA